MYPDIDNQDNKSDLIGKKIIDVDNTYGGYVKLKFSDGTTVIFEADVGLWWYPEPKEEPKEPVPHKLRTTGRNKQRMTGHVGP